ncbi:MAG: hypothetical protein AAF360_07165, partial [Pseudomonadota bacterium]
RRGRRDPLRRDHAPQSAGAGVVNPADISRLGLVAERMLVRDLGALAPLLARDADLVRQDAALAETARRERAEAATTVANIQARERFEVAIAARRKSLAATRVEIAREIETARAAAIRSLGRTHALEALAERARAERRKAAEKRDEQLMAAVAAVKTQRLHR